MNNNKLSEDNTGDEDQGSDRPKSWITFEEQAVVVDTDNHHRDVRLDMPSNLVSSAATMAANNSGGSSFVATIEPTDSIHVSAANAHDISKQSTSPIMTTSLTIGLPLNQSNQITDANIMSNINTVSNKVIDKSFKAITNNNNNYVNDMQEIRAETSDGTNVGNKSSLQQVSLKDVVSNNGNNNDDNAVVNQCNHQSNAQIDGYSNGDIIVTLLPVNDHCSWLSPAKFKPELVPEELMAQSLSLTVEDYVSAIQVLVNDLRFNLYITLYKRMLAVWIALGFAILLSILFSGMKGLPLFVGGVIWLVVNVFGIFVTMFFKVKLYHLLERCISQVNRMLYKNNILLGVDDRGSLSCHKINLIFIYFDVTYCIKFLKDMLDNENRSANGDQQQHSVPMSNTSSILSRMDINTEDVIITGTQPKTLSQKETYAEKLLLRYSQRWVKDFVRRKIDLNMPLHADAAGVPVTALPSAPRHCSSSRCLCQFIEEHLKFKPLTQCNITELFM
ncbi:transmembrane protein 268-like [Oppia nitens]|uniref:transmembrane protein 268-like n=1 Tax=Oppia nitens TaxID=1686743 RepID=UPI0023DABD1D|nr:transmembrane protein 268-like [Oppia nitens]